MTGTPSRTATAYGGGPPRHSVADDTAMPRGYAGRQLQAKLWSEEHESHMRHMYDGRGSVAFQNPTVIRICMCRCGGYMERKSHVLPREIFLSACETGSERGIGAAVEEDLAVQGSVTLQTERTTRDARTGKRAREAARSTKGRKKSAESISRLRKAAKEEHVEMNRNGAFDE